jgi:hypothetical protein
MGAKEELEKQESNRGDLTSEAKKSNKSATQEKSKEAKRAKAK